MRGAATSQDLQDESCLECTEAVGISWAVRVRFKSWETCPQHVHDWILKTIGCAVRHWKRRITMLVSWVFSCFIRGDWKSKLQTCKVGISGLGEHWFLTLKVWASSSKTLEPRRSLWPRSGTMKPQRWGLRCVAFADAVGLPAKVYSDLWQDLWSVGIWAFDPLVMRRTFNVQYRFSQVRAWVLCTMCRTVPWNYLKLEDGTLYLNSMP